MNRPHFPDATIGAAHKQGMTLIELLVAIALLAITASLAWRGLDTLGRNSQQLTEHSQRWQSLALFFNRFSHDVSQPVARPIHVGPVRPADTASPATTGDTLNQRFAARYTAALKAMMPQADHSQADSLPAWLGRTETAADLAPDQTADGNATENERCALEFTRKSSRGQDEIRLGYRLRGSQVELLLWPVLDRKNAPGDGQTTKAALPAVHPLLDGVSKLHFQHLDDNNQWQDHWPPAGTPQDRLPRAVAIELELLDGTRLRRIFALPM
ncbi:MAG: prepilin-type N-terminal cleavage/methylation domain-containing protein [Sterolibacterium sp.]|nr:prepilin-type N-terminal cleavage/methylation domain-containing protein [Sterolibacterium sp.]